MNAHPEFRMAMKDGELVIWDSVHPCYTVFHEQTETFSSLWSEYHDDFRQFLHIYSQDVACYGENRFPAYFPKGFIENMFFVSANPRVSFTSFDLNGQYGQLSSPPFSPWANIIRKATRC